MATRQTTAEPELAPRKKGKSASKTGGADGVWVGEHTSDGDVLILDPTGDSAPAGRVSYYSLSQCRWRVFPAAIAKSKIRELTDATRVAQAREEYGRRAELEAEQEAARIVAQAEVAERQREQVIRLHEKYLEGHGIEHEGVRETPSDHKSRRSRCHACGISLDDFVGRACIACGEVLCSCGACGCGRKPAR